MIAGRAFAVKGKNAGHYYDEGGQRKLTYLNRLNLPIFSITPFA